MLKLFIKLIDRLQFSTFVTVATMPANYISNQNTFSNNLFWEVSKSKGTKLIHIQNSEVVQLKALKLSSDFHYVPWMYIVS